MHLLVPAASVGEFCVALLHTTHSQGEHGSCHDITVAAAFTHCAYLLLYLGEVCVALFDTVHPQGEHSLLTLLLCTQYFAGVQPVMLHIATFDSSTAPLHLQVLQTVLQLMALLPALIAVSTLDVCSLLLLLVTCTLYAKSFYCFSVHSH
jgi:hypothetical protein